MPQKKEGGNFNIRGEDDQKVYRAQYIGTPLSGMLPDQPVVLASEAGPEYFVSNKDLQNPVVANYVRMIDNIAKARQFREGGFSQEPVATPSTEILDLPTPENEKEERMLVAVNRLIELLEDGIEARISDDTALEIDQRVRELDEVSGGALRE